MKEASLETMELGNAIFGNSRGEYSIPRDEWEDIFYEFLENNGFDTYGCPDYDKNFNPKNGMKRVSNVGDPAIENDIFLIRPYYWGDDETIAKLPNFVYKPTNLEIQWYKYPFRDAYSNQDIELEEFQEILKCCEQSLRKD